MKMPAAVGGNMQTLVSQNGHQPYHDDHLNVDLRYELVTLDREILTLTRKEYSLLALMVQDAGKIVPRATFLIQIWGAVPETRTRTVDMHIDQLRKKVTNPPAEPGAFELGPLEAASGRWRGPLKM
jgi:DNA-binding response OmpR family regulator